MKNMKRNNSSSIQVIERMARLLDAVSAYDHPVTLKVLGADTGLHPSTAHRILAAMVNEGFVERDARGAYRLGYKLVQLGCRMRGDATVEQVALPVMEALRDQVGETVNLTVREGDEVVYVARAIVTTRIMRVEQVIGSRAPLHVTAVGKLALGEMDAGEIHAYASRTRLPRFTPNTIVDPERLVKEAQYCHGEGFALDNEEAEMGVGCIGSLIRDGSATAVAGLSVSAPMDRRREEWIAMVMEAANQISERLGYHAQREPSVSTMVSPPVDARS